MSGGDDGLIGRMKQKLVASKEAWAREGRHLTGDAGRAPAERLPPGQHRVTNWPVLDLGIQPDVTPADWRLTVDGLVEAPLDWTWVDFTAQPAFADVSDIHCVTTWSRYDNHWEGVASRRILELARPLPTARHVICHSYDGYTTNLTLEMFADADVLLASGWEGKPISREHGGPVRMVVPKFYFWKSAKWLRRLEFTEKDRPGFWEVRGYHNTGDPWTEQRYG